MILPMLWRRGITPGIRHGQFAMQNFRCLTTTAATNLNTNTKAEEDFFVKNKRLNRPMSPHLTIYQPQITWILSITHRGTGLAMSGLASVFAFGSLLSSSPFPTWLVALQSAHYGSGIIFLAKYIIAFPFFFHTFNGIRHLAWDMGKGFELKEVYVSGYSVLGASILASLAVAAM